MPILQNVSRTSMYQQHKSLTFMVFPMANFLSNPNDDDESAFA